MVPKWWLRMGLLSLFVLAGCKPPTPTPTPTTGAGGPSYPGLAPTETPLPNAYPAGVTPPATSQVPGTPTVGPYPAPTSGEVSHLVPL